MSPFSAGVASDFERKHHRAATGESFETGTLVLTGMGNAYGATNVAAGANLIVGGGNSSSGWLGSGPINNSGHITFAEASSLLVAVPLSGPGTPDCDATDPDCALDTAVLTEITSAGVLTLLDPGGVLGGGPVTNAAALLFLIAPAWSARILHQFQALGP